MAVISLRLIFEAMGRVKIFKRENRKSWASSLRTSGFRDWDKAAKELGENQNGVNNLH